MSAEPYDFERYRERRLVEDPHQDAKAFSEHLRRMIERKAAENYVCRVCRNSFERIELVLAATGSDHFFFFCKTHAYAMAFDPDERAS